MKIAIGDNIDIYVHSNNRELVMDLLNFVSDELANNYFTSKEIKRSSTAVNKTSKKDTKKTKKKDKKVTSINLYSIGIRSLPLTYTIHTYLL